MHVNHKGISFGKCSLWNSLSTQSGLWWNLLAGESSASCDRDAQEVSVDRVTSLCNESVPEWLPRTAPSSLDGAAVPLGVPRLVCYGVVLEGLSFICVLCLKIYFAPPSPYYNFLSSINIGDVSGAHSLQPPTLSDEVCFFLWLEAWSCTLWNHSDKHSGLVYLPRVMDVCSAVATTG